MAVHERLLVTLDIPYDSQLFLNWQWFNHHEQMWNNHTLHTTRHGYNYYTMNLPTTWQPA